MHRNKKKKVVAIFLVLVALFAGAFYIKGKDVEKSTKRIYADKNQKFVTAADPKGKDCANILADNLNLTVDNKTDDGHYVIRCKPTNTLMSAIGKKEVTVNITNMQKIKLPNSITCKKGKETVYDVISLKEQDFNSYAFQYTIEGKTPNCKSSQLKNTIFGTSDNSADIPDITALEEYTEDAGTYEDGFDIPADEAIELSSSASGFDEATAADMQTDLTKVEDLEEKETTPEYVQRNNVLYANTAQKNANDYYSFSRLMNEANQSGAKFIKYSNMTLKGPYEGDYTRAGTIDFKNFSSARQTLIKNKGIIMLDCDYKLTEDDITASEALNRKFSMDEAGNLTNYYYDQSNTTYLYGIATHTYEAPQPIVYSYHPDNLNTVTVSYTPKCTKTCEEIVKIEYGPPMFVTAGICFEYRAKVTSIVKCSSDFDEKLIPKPDKLKVCQTKPTCKKRQGGPNNMYEECVTACDGGKYSEACSNKCYKQVYAGNSGNNLINDLVENIPATVMKSKSKSNKNKNKNKNKDKKKEEPVAYPTVIKGTSLCKAPGTSGVIYGGGYYRKSTGTIAYCPFSDPHYTQIHGTKSCDKESHNEAIVKNSGLWYRQVNYNIKHIMSRYGIGDDGIIRACYKNDTQLCGESCGWGGADKCAGKYLKFGMDKIGTCSTSRNYGSYIHAGSVTDKEVYSVNADGTKTVYICDAKDLARKEYRINRAIYVTAVKEADKMCSQYVKCTTSTATFNIGFKYNDSTNKTDPIQTIEYPTSKLQSITPENTTPPGKINTAIASRAQILLSYGGCYRHTGENRRYQAEWTFPGVWISNKLDIAYMDPNSEAYGLKPGKVCIPTDHHNVSGRWAQRYYDTAFRNRPIDANRLSEAWKCTFTGDIEKDWEDNTTVDGYNIKASTTKFGFFKWNIEIYCFYSLINNASDNTPTGSDNEVCDPPDDETIESNTHTYNENSDPTNANQRVQYRGAGKVGFNWKAEATLTKFGRTSVLGGGYQYNPQKLIAVIQSEGVPSEPDYSYHLTPEIMAKIRSYNKKVPLGSFEEDGKLETKNGVIGYKSNFLRSTATGYTGFSTMSSTQYENLRGINNSNATYREKIGGN